MLKTNVDQLVKISVAGEVANASMPALPASPYIVSANGEPVLIPAYGGLVYNIRIGDRAVGWAGELIQPGVSIKNGDANANTALGVYACLGNPARVVSGMASGAKGIVVGKSGRFADHVICYFPQSDLENMAPGDKVLVKAFGVGLCLQDHPGIEMKSCSPELLELLNYQSSGDSLVVRVKAIVPNYIVGAGSGFQSENKVINLQMTYPEVTHDSRLDELKFGDLVAVSDWDSRYTHSYLKGSVTIGVVSQGASVRSGYGPGITVIMTCRTGELIPEVNEEATIAHIVKNILR